MKKPNIRDKELDRLIKYANGLGARVSIKKSKPGQKFGALWIEGGEEIILYTWPRQSKVSLILNLMHELGHHLDFISKNRLEDQKIIKALLEDEEAAANNRKLDKEKRRLIFETEIAGVLYRPKIAKEVGITIPFYKIKADMDLDIWIYKRYYETGKMPFSYEIREKKDELSNFYKEKYGALKALNITDEEL